MTAPTLRPARPDEATALTALCLRSKAVWGYDKAFMRACRDELTLTAETIRASRVQVAELDGHVVGVAEVAVRRRTASLERLFVDPDALRSGVGRALLAWAHETAAAAGATILTIEADPDAAGFYRRLGAVGDGFAASSSIPSRFIPRLRLDL